ncbi:hypothetical protein FB45DRAFT_795265 [Roridomyces roridus]|uniref:F-box domain-containing protein n=1 Tax=Roridomyces roridus TaxID=1738132 RepID=A0AAD7FJ08_9AGAR|nr:hypothetical protein FB45DRAFT_795265 [Roridomyces roridus]
MQTHELRKRLEALDSEISKLDTVPEDLEAQRDAILDELDLVTYPVLTLAPEVTTEIFMWCKVNSLHSRSISLYFTPFLLTRICRAWRSLALSIPALWDSFPDLHLEYYPDVEESVDEWLTRAGTRPISLALCAPPDAEAPVVERMVHKYAARLKHLRLDVPSLEDFKAVPAFPVLSQLVISNLDDMDDILTGENNLFDADGAPALDHLSLTSVLPISLINMPWKQLTKLSLCFVPLTHTLTALQSATGLVEFNRRFSPEEEEEPDTSLSVRHTLITSFALTGRDEDHDILPWLTLPRLERMQLGGIDGEYEDTLDSNVSPFLERVSSTLTTLVLGMAPTPPVEWLLPLTELTTLELVRSNRSVWRGPQFTTDVIRALDRRTSPDVLPKLQTFVLSNCGSDRVDDELLGVLGSRCDEDGAHARLESFRLIWTAPITGDEFRLGDYSDSVLRLPLINVLPLRALAARGLRIHIGTDDVNNFY